MCVCMQVHTHIFILISSISHLYMHTCIYMWVREKREVSEWVTNSLMCVCMQVHTHIFILISSISHLFAHIHKYMWVREKREINNKYAEWAFCAHSYVCGYMHQLCMFTHTLISSISHLYMHTCTYKLRVREKREASEWVTNSLMCVCMQVHTHIYSRIEEIAKFIFANLLLPYIVSQR